MKIDKILNLFNLHSTEKDIFKICLEANGGIGATEISKKVGINRTSTYDFLDNLVQAGLIIESQKSGIKRFFIQKPELISLLIEIKNKEIIEAQEAIHRLKEEYYSENKKTRPKLQIYEGKKELQQMMNDMLLYQDIVVYSFWPIEDVINVLGKDFYDEFHKKRIRSNIEIKVIWPEKHSRIRKKYKFLEKGINLKRETRIAPSNINFSLGYAIYKNTVRFFSSKKENYGFLIESEEMADMMKKQFDIIWEKSEPLNE